MKTQSPGKIFLSDERGLNEMEWFRSLNTFNFGNYHREHKQPFGDLYLLNDDMLAGGKTMSMLVEDFTHVIILPVAGAVNFKRPGAYETLVAAGQILIHSANPGDKFEITNPFLNETVNFLQVWIRGDKGKNILHTGPLTYEDVSQNRDTLINAFQDVHQIERLPFSFFIGKFSGRGEAVYKPSKKNTGCFLFVLEGAFEAEGRLLHSRDGLALWDTNEIEMEALSNDAILLLIETTL